VLVPLKALRVVTRRQRCCLFLVAIILVAIIAMVVVSLTFKDPLLW